MPASSAILTDTLLSAGISFAVVKEIVSPVIFTLLTGTPFTETNSVEIESGIVNPLSKAMKTCPLPPARAPIVPVLKSISYPLPMPTPERSAENFTLDTTDGFIVTVK